jgi:hypothetical protein
MDAPTGTVPSVSLVSLDLSGVEALAGCGWRRRRSSSNTNTSPLLLLAGQRADPRCHALSTSRLGSSGMRSISSRKSSG